MTGCGSAFQASVVSSYPSVLLLGPTGSGKTPLGQQMAQQGIWGRACIHFDFGAQLRRLAGQAPVGPADPAWHGKPACRPESAHAGKTLSEVAYSIRSQNGPPERNSWGGSFFTPAERAFIGEVLRTGALLEKEHFPLALKILKYFLVEMGVVDSESLGPSEAPRVARGHGGCLPLMVLNGLPRHVGQAEALKDWLDVQAVVHLDCPAQVVLQRIQTNVGGDRQGRTDDDWASVQAKLATHQARTQPLIHYYQSQGIPIIRLEVTAAMTPKEAWQELQKKNPYSQKNNIT